MLLDTPAHSRSSTLHKACIKGELGWSQNCLLRSFKNALLCLNTDLSFLHYKNLLWCNGLYTTQEYQGKYKWNFALLKKSSQMSKVNMKKITNKTLHCSKITFAGI